MSMSRNSQKELLEQAYVEYIDPNWDRIHNPDAMMKLVSEVLRQYRNGVQADFDEVRSEWTDIPEEFINAIEVVFTEQFSYFDQSI